MQVLRTISTVFEIISVVFEMKTVVFGLYNVLYGYRKVRDMNHVIVPVRLCLASWRAYFRTGTLGA